jgi:hypothetical protein
VHLGTFALGLSGTWGLGHMGTWSVARDFGHMCSWALSRSLMKTVFETNGGRGLAFC